MYPRQFEYVGNNASLKPFVVEFTNINEGIILKSGNRFYKVGDKLKHIKPHTNEIWREVEMDWEE